MPSKPSAKVATIPAPKLGWNARDPLSAMKPGYAVVMDNMIPGTDGVDLRFGNIQHAAALNARVSTLMQYSAPSGGNKMFAVAGGKIFNVTTTGNAVDPDVTDLGSSIFSSTMFGNAGGNYLTACNGVDAVQQYNGSAWSNPEITGVEAENLVFVHAHAERLWFLEANSTRAWYLGVDAIEGAASKLELGSMLNLGGSLVAMASWTRDGGSGADDVAVFLSSKGEVVLFSGTDPDSTDTWQRVGVFKIAPPIGRRCIMKFGADLAVITSQGVVPLSTILPASQGQGEGLSITDNIKGAFNQAYIQAGILAGWEIIEYPRKQLILVNVPGADGTSFQQYVMNVATKGWCRFTGWNASCWCLLGEKLYFGTTDGKIMVLTDDNLDNGSAIPFDCLPAFFDYNTANVKFFKQARGLFTAVQGTDPPFEMKTNFDTTPASIAQGPIPIGGSPWGSPWGSSWGPPITSILNFQSVVGHGVVGSPRLKGASRSTLKWHQTTVLYEIGGPY